MSEPQKSFDVSELWATNTTWTLHATADCCGNRGHSRLQVKDHAKPDYFDLDRFALCPAASALSNVGGGEDG